MTVTIERELADILAIRWEKISNWSVQYVFFNNLFFFLPFFLDIQTRPTFAREELTEADLDKMVVS